MTTPAAAPAQTEAPQVEAAEEHQVDEAGILADVFPELAQDDEPEQAETKPKPAKAQSSTQTKDEPEDDDAEEPDAEQVDPLKLIGSDELFSDKALSTKQGIAKARETLVSARKAARELHQTANDAHVRAKRHEQIAHKRAADATRSLKAAQALEARVTADLDTAFNSGDAGAVREALSRLTKRDASKLYEQWTEVEIGKRKAPQRDPALDEIKSELQSLKQQKEAEREAAQRQELNQRRVAWLEGLDRDIGANQAEYRAIHHMLQTGPAAVRELVEYADNKAREMLQELGHWPRNAELLQRIESEIRPLVKLPKVAPTQPAPSGKPGRLPGRSVSPSLGSQRSFPKSLDEMTQEEREEKMAEDAEEILGGLGLLG